MDAEIRNDNRPIAQRRKRRACSTLSSPLKDPAPTSTVRVEIPLCRITKTPSKPKKRVRFSDPGPEVTASPTSTAITPIIQRATIQEANDPPLPTPRLRGRPRRRASTPSSSRPDSSHANGMSSPIEVRVAPLRQILSERSQRRMRRRQLSEETNAIEADRKFERSQADEIRRLREELDHIRRESVEPSVATKGFEQAREHNAETRTPKPSVRKPLATIEPGIPTPERGDSVAPDNSPELDTDFAPIPSFETPPETPTTPCPTVGVATQTTLAGPDALVFESHIARQTAHLVSARLELERLFPGETPLGLEPAAGDPTHAPHDAGSSHRCARSRSQHAREL